MGTLILSATLTMLLRCRSRRLRRCGVGGVIAAANSPKRASALVGAAWSVVFCAVSLNYW